MLVPRILQSKTVRIRIKEPLSGFTFVETILVAALTPLIAFCVYKTFVTGLTLYERMFNQERFTEYHAASYFQRVEDDFRNCSFIMSDDTSFIAIYNMEIPEEGFEIKAFAMTRLVKCHDGVFGETEPAIVGHFFSKQHNAIARLELLARYLNSENGGFEKANLVMHLFNIQNVHYQIYVFNDELNQYEWQTFDEDGPAWVPGGESDPPEGTFYIGALPEALQVTLETENKNITRIFWRDF